MNVNGYSQNSVYSFWSYGDTDTVTDIETLTFCLHCTDAVFTNLYLLGQRYYDLFHRSFKMLMKYFVFTMKDKKVNKSLESLWIYTNLLNMHPY